MIMPKVLEDYGFNVISSDIVRGLWGTANRVNFF